MERLGVGIIGCGFVGRGAHVPALDAIEGANLIAVADRDASRLAKVTKKYQVAATYPDYTELINDPAVQAVVVSVPTPLHVPAALAAIEAGKHVLCEMPLASNLEEADRLIEAAREKGVVLMPSLTFRFTPNYVKAKELIGSGAVGQVSAITYREWIPAQDLAQQWPPGAWVWNVEKSGGPLYTLAVWSIDLVRWLTESEVTEVHASTKYTVLEKTGGTLGYDAMATLQMANGMVASLQYSGSVNEAATISVLDVVGNSTSVLKATGNDRVTLLGDDPEKTEWNVKQSGARMWGHLQQDDYFVTCIREGRQPEVTPEDGRKAMEIAVEIAKACP